MENPFGICQRLCDLHPENCGHCTEPLQCGEWTAFWKMVSFYSHYRVVPDEFEGAS